MLLVVSLWDIIFTLVIPGIVFILYQRLHKIEVESANAAASDQDSTKNKGKLDGSSDFFDREDFSTNKKESAAMSPTASSDALPLDEDVAAGDPLEAAPSSVHRIAIAYASSSRQSFQLAHTLFSHVQATLTTKSSKTSSWSEEVVPEVRVMEINEADPLGFSIHSLLEERFSLVIFVVSTFTDGRAPPTSQSFELLLQDAFLDHRVNKSVLASKNFALFGLGDTAYGAKDYNRFGKNLVLWCRGLGAPPFVVPPVYASESVTQRLFQHFSHSLQQWLFRTTFLPDGTVQTVKKKSKDVKMRKKKASLFQEGEGGDGSTEILEEGAGDHEDRCCQSKLSEDIYDSDSEEESEASLEDVEELVWDESKNVDPENLPELLYPKLRQNLTKQGYKIIGTHSAVKLCRWTKSMLRGRGGCYKHTFYNINSSQCMEMTPSLACANKCIFCWRHHTNPVSRSFQWKQDPPEMLIERGMFLHYQMIKQMRGVPGVTPESLQTAMTIRHAALSLVGEPIMYPGINRFCQLLHEKRISSFMVTNAQFPDQLSQLQPVVQLYLSIDASTPEELKHIDRPLFEDYWERCIQCLQILKQKKQRTVLRLTLVNQYNTENISSYADLVMQSWPDFIEVKGVTYCGTSRSSTLTMKENVPRHDEVIRFCTDLCVELGKRHIGYTTPQMANSSFILEEEMNRPYHIACEHEHSCCVLIALDKFFIHGQWHTWIDYDRFFDLIEDGQVDFSALDYASPTPSWAVYRSPEAGFDPLHQRVKRTGKSRPTGEVGKSEA